MTAALATTALTPDQYRALDAAAHRGDTHVTLADGDTYVLCTLAGLGLGTLEFADPDGPAHALRLNRAAWMAWSDETDRLTHGGTPLPEPTHSYVYACTHGCIAGDVCPNCGHVGAGAAQ